LTVTVDHDKVELPVQAGYQLPCHAIAVDAPQHIPRGDGNIVLDELNVYAVFAVKGSVQRSVQIDTLVTIKKYDESLDLDRIAFFLAHPSANRRLAFSFKETLPSAWRTAVNVPGNYGYPCDTEDTGDLYFRTMHGRDEAWSSAEGAVGEVKKMLSDKGISIK